MAITFNYLEQFSILILTLLTSSKSWGRKQIFDFGEYSGRVCFSLTWKIPNFSIKNVDE